MIRVLLADDVAQYRALVRTLLERDGRFEVVGEAGDGVEAVELSAREQPDVVLLDVAMPRMDGLQAIPKIAASCSQAKIVVLSGFARDQLERQALAAGAIAYLDKGADVSRIASTLTKVVERVA